MQAGEPCGKQGIKLLWICNSYVCLRRRQPLIVTASRSPSSTQQFHCTSTLVNLFLLSVSDSISTIIMHACCYSCIPEHYRQNRDLKPTLHIYLPCFLLGNQVPNEARSGTHMMKMTINSHHIDNKKGLQGV